MCRMRMKGECTNVDNTFAMCICVENLCFRYVFLGEFGVNGCLIKQVSMHFVHDGNETADRTLG